MNPLLLNKINNNLLLYLQPIYCVKTSKISAYEVLSRLEENNKLYNPIEFLSGTDIKEHYHLAKAVLKRIDRVIKHIDDDSIKLHINFNPDDLKHTVVMDLILKYKDFIVVEIMEDSNNIKDIILLLLELRKNDVTIALDDFGDKNSTYNYIIDRSEAYDIFQIIKIDGSLVKDIDTKSHKLLFLKKLIDVMKSDKKQKVCVEYIDSEKKKDLAIKLGADYLQGFLLKKPCCYKEF